MTRLTAQEHDNELFRDIVERAGDFVIIVHDVHDRGQIPYANEAARRHSDLDRAALETWKPHDFDALIKDDFFVEPEAGPSSGHSLRFNPSIAWQTASSRLLVPSCTLWNKRAGCCMPVTLMTPASV